jgi:dienelactone hydrolase
MLLGEADDWTPAAPCHQLAERSAPPRPEVVGYAGAYHGFDSNAPVRVRRDVPNGTHPGEGVHVGGNAQAHAASRERLKAFIQAYATAPSAR